MKTIPLGVNGAANGSRAWAKRTKSAASRRVKRVLALAAEFCLAVEGLRELVWQCSPDEFADLALAEDGAGTLESVAVLVDSSLRQMGVEVGQ